MSRASQVEDILEAMGAATADAIRRALNGFDAKDIAAAAAAIAGAGGNGGSVPEQEIISDAGVSTPPGGANMAFVHQSGDALLDLTDPNNPEVIEAGTYAITLLCTLDATDATVLNGALSLPVGSSVQTAVPVSVANSALGVTLSVVVILAAGDAFSYVVTHNNTGSRICGLSGYIVKLA